MLQYFPFWGNTFNSLFQVSSTFSLKYFGLAAMRRVIYKAFSSGAAEGLERWKEKESTTARDPGTVGSEPHSPQ